MTKKKNTMTKKKSAPKNPVLPTTVYGIPDDFVLSSGHYFNPSYENAYDGDVIGIYELVDIRTVRKTTTLE